MVAYSFKARFAPLIRSGAKTQTVRAERKRHALAGETLQLYTGMRTRSCKLIAKATCVAVSPIRFVFEPQPLIFLHGLQHADEATLDHFAQRDGFTGWADLAAFWAKEHPDLTAFSGVLIQWRSDGLELGPE